MMELILPQEFRLEARLSNAMTMLSGADWCIPHHVKECDYDLIQRIVDVTIRDSVDGAVTRFFNSFYRDDTPSQFILSTIDRAGRIHAKRLFEECTVMEHRVKTTTEYHALLAHHIVLKYETLVVS
jgi:hypothetical protein